MTVKAPRLPNPEQKLAIEHFGGCVLSAGAGSGKTFVLIEHIVYLINEFNKTVPLNDEVTYKNELRKYLSSIVLMTFTKKATGELKIRAQRRIEDELNFRNTKEWQWALELIDVLNITTIDGFCFKLLKSGLIEGTAPNISIVDQFEITDRIKKIVAKWIGLHQKDHQNKEVVDYLKYHLDQVNSIFVKVFSSPEVRRQWYLKKSENIFEIEYESFWHEYLKLSDLDGVLKIPNLDLAKGQEKNKWYKLLSDFSLHINSKNPFSLEGMHELNQIFTGNLTSPMFAKNPDLVYLQDYWEQFKEFRSTFKELSVQLIEFHESKEFAYQWNGLLVDLFHFIHHELNFYEGISFADLEFLVCEKLGLADICKRIRENYQYFIIDEFQDTSPIQYEIVSRIIDNNFDKVFCVGDLKQAIYGFRGGEISVFQDAMSKVKLNLSMSANYRSSEKVIDFNNYLFEHLFKLGQKFVARPEANVEVDFQKYPGGKDFSGTYYQVNLEFNNPDIVKEFDYYESNAIVDHIKKLQVKYNNEQICILYRKLAPLKFLIPELIAKNISFTSQYKIKYSEEPIIYMFCLLVEGLFLQHNEKKRTNILLSKVFAILNLNEALIEKSCLSFSEDVKYFGLNSAWTRFLFAIGVSFSTHALNCNFIEKIILLGAGNFETVYKYIKVNSDQSINLDFSFGNNPSSVIVMTAHASKGLEFDHVIFGGIQTNGRTKGDKSWLGKEVGSFKYKKQIGSNEFVSTPQFILEQVSQKKKEFAESMRLFYVAGTRSKKTISWINFSNVERKVDSSWVFGIQNFINHQNNQVTGLIKSESITIQGIEEMSEEDIANKLQTPPLFQTDRISITNINKERDSIVIPELSVTKLSKLVDCPRKYYLNNIIKIDDEDLERVEKNESKIINSTDGIKSSADRGTLIHERIAMSLTRSSKVLHDLDEADIGVVEWAIAQIETNTLNKERELISETALKFEIYGHMINAIPDLITISNGKAIIWDFKTGRLSDKKLDNYWMQLKLYAKALYDLNYVDKNSTISLKLMFVDERKILDENVDEKSNNQYLYQLIQNSNSFDKINQDHCPSCQYRKICHPRKLA